MTGSYSDSLIAYVPVRYDDTVSTLTPPPSPELILSTIQKLHNKYIKTFAKRLNEIYRKTKLPIQN